MKAKECPVCGRAMVRNGRTSAGSQRWRCMACGASQTHSIDTGARDLAAFVDWILSKDVQADMPGAGRSFRRHASAFWSLWPMPEVVDEVHRVIYVDGIWLARDVVILIAASGEHVLSWYIARAETTASWTALLSRIAPPDMVVTDGGPGFARAAKEAWPKTRVQRCLYHVFAQVRRYTTSRPNLQAGIELYALAKDLLCVKTLFEANAWTERYLEWSAFWADFLEERSIVDGRRVYTHERLRKARSGVATLINRDVLFTYLKPEVNLGEVLPATNNRIERINGQLREVMRNHRGMSLLHRVKAVYWWCYMHTECPRPFSELLRTMPRDEDIELLRREYAIKPDEIGRPARWGDALVWEEMHRQTRYPYSSE